MSRTVTLRLKEDIYEKFRALAEDDNRTISNFIETSVLRSIENSSSIDEFEMADIRADKSLLKSIDQGLHDVKRKKGRFVK